MLVVADGAWWAGGPPIVPLSTVGAGDSTLAGFLAADGLAAATASGPPSPSAAPPSCCPAPPSPTPPTSTWAPSGSCENPDPRLALKEL